MANEINPDAAVDLAAHMQQLEAIREVADAKERAEIEVRAAEWDRNMGRAFKGIMSSPVRHAFLKRAIDGPEQE